MLVWYDILPLKTSPSGQGGTAVPSVIFDVNSTDGQILTEPAMAVMAAPHGAHGVLWPWP